MINVSYINKTHMSQQQTFKLSAIITILNDITYLDQSIKSILNHVDEIVIVDVPFGTKRYLSNEMAKQIKSYDYEKISYVMAEHYIPRYQAMQLGEAVARNDWIMRWDSDFVAYEDEIPSTLTARPFKDLMQICKEKQNIYDVFYLYAPVFAWDYYHSKPSQLYKTHNLYVARKGKVIYGFNDKYYLTYGFNNSRVFYLNNPFQSFFYFVYLAECKSTEEMVFNTYKNMYYTHLLCNNKTPETCTFDDFYLEKYNKKVKYSASGLIKSIKSNIIKHIHPVPIILEKKPALTTYRVREESNFTYRDITYNDLRSVNDSIQTNVTIVTLMRNTEPYLKEYFESIFNQTYTKWNIIMVNDGSNGGPINLDLYIEKKYSHFKSKIKLIEFPQWQGLVKCHLEAMKHVMTDIVIIFDSDDTLDPTALDYIVYTYNKHDIVGDPDIFVYGNFFYCDANMNKVSLGYNRPTINTYLIDRPGVACRSFRMRHYLQTKGYDPNLLFGAEDQDLLFQISRVAKPVYLDKYIYNYRRINFGGSISSMRRMSTYSLQLSIIKNAFETYMNNKFYLRIYSNINPTEKLAYVQHNQYQIHGDSGIKLEGINYFIEININHKVPFIVYFNMTDYRTYQDLIDHHIQLYHQGSNNTSVEITWNPSNAVWEVSDKKVFNLESAAIFTPDHYFDYILGLESFQIEGIRCDQVVTLDHIPSKLKDLTFKKLLIITDPNLIPSDIISSFNLYIRSIPYDWDLVWFTSGGKLFGIGIDVKLKDHIKTTTDLALDISRVLNSSMSVYRAKF